MGCRPNLVSLEVERIAQPIRNVNNLTALHGLSIIEEGNKRTVHFSYESIESLLGRGAWWR
jgi:hypothetical protein